MRKQVFKPVIQLPLVGKSSDCIHFLILSLIGLLPLFLVCHVFDLLLLFNVSICLWTRGPEEGGRARKRIEFSLVAGAIKDGLRGASHS